MLEGRTHPQMTMSATGGYILTGIKVCLESQKSKAVTAAASSYYAEQRQKQKDGSAGGGEEEEEPASKKIKT
jgi:hypothetical protein